MKQKKPLLFIAVSMLFISCNSLEDFSTNTNQSDQYNKDLKAFYDKQYALWSSYNAENTTRNNDNDGALGFDEYEDNPYIQQIERDFISFCNDHNDILRYSTDVSLYQATENMTLEEKEEYLRTHCSKEYNSIITTILESSFSTIDADKITYNTNINEKERLSLIYMSAAINSRINSEITDNSKFNECKKAFQKASDTCAFNYILSCATSFCGSPIIAVFGIAIATYQYDQCDKGARSNYKDCLKR